MADLLFEADDRDLAQLEIIAHNRGISLEDYLRELIIAEARNSAAEDGSDK